MDLQSDRLGPATRVATFDDKYAELVNWINRRRPKWTLSRVPFEDARQIILIYFARHWDYDPAKGEFSHWANSVITSQIKNIWRDHLTKWSRPCILGCTDRIGEEACRVTPSGKQCSECPLYAEWARKKGQQFNINQTLSIDAPTNGAQAYNVQSDFVDVEARKRQIDEFMKVRVTKGKLTKSDHKIYRLLYVKGLSERETAKQMGFSKSLKGKKERMFNGYGAILASKHRLKEAVKEIIEEEGLGDER